MQTATIVGPSVGGLLYASAGPGGCFLINAGSFLAVLASVHHSHWSQLHPWTIWFIILVLAAILDLVIHRSVF